MSRAFFTGYLRWAGVDKAWEQEKLEASLSWTDSPGKNARKCRRLPHVRCIIIPALFRDALLARTDECKTYRLKKANYRLNGNFAESSLSSKILYQLYQCRIIGCACKVTAFIVLLIVNEPDQSSDG